MKKLPVKEYYKALKSFQKNKSPGNDGITVEFYLGFWHLISKTLVDALITLINMVSYLNDDMITVVKITSQW